jgi:hypothetical protein
LSGARFTVGGWFDHEESLGLEANFLIVEGQSTHFEAASDGSQILARPFFDAQTNLLAADLIAFPGVVAGAVAVQASSSGLTGAEVNFREKLCCGAHYEIDVLGGYRYLHHDDRVSIFENLTTLDTTARFGPAGSNVSLVDAFSAKNEFHGGNFGLEANIWRDRWILGLLAKAAVGYSHEVVEINGATQFTAPGATPVFNPGGLLALTNNIGHHDRWLTPVIPEFGIHLSYQVTCQLRLSVGYTLIFWGDVVRAGDQIDFLVNSAGLPSPTGAGAATTSPAFLGRTTGFWAQGVDFGLEWRY